MKIPASIKVIVSKLEEKGFEAYIVGGCVRDLLLEKEPGDWDITTNAKPTEIQKIMEDAEMETFYENEFLTVGVVVERINKKKKATKDDKEVVEITTYRLETKYTDKRHPDEIKAAKTLFEDLARRDFTVNAMVLSLRKARGEEVIDPYDGRKDLKNRIIKAVGNPKDRFAEDALRMLRAARFATVLKFGIEDNTKQAIIENSRWLKVISQERIRDELVKIIMSDNAAEGIELLRQLGLLRYIIPELEQGYQVSQNKHHVYDCYEHNILSLKYACKKSFNVYVRIAALLHDVAKPKTKRGEGPDATFYGHEIVGARMVKKILERLKFSKKDVEKITKLVRYHLFYYNVDEVSESSVRRLVRQVGPEDMEELLQVRMADRIGSGVPKAEPYKLRHLRYVIEKISEDPISVKMIAIRGDKVMKILNIEPGPKVGQVLNVLMGEILADPKKNNKEFLEQETKRLGSLAEKELIGLAKKAEKEKEALETKNDEMTKKKYWVT
ncbi:MAG: HD domain-containing protein [bacterium]